MQRSVYPFASPSSMNLPAARMNGATVVSNGYLYYIGGSDNSTPPAAQTTVYYAKMNANGTLGAWATTTSLPTAANNGSAVVANGVIYVYGANDGVRNGNIY